MRTHLLRCSAVAILFACGAVTAEEPGSSTSPAAEPSFRQDVMPVLFRAGCNAGTCHGSARGKDGFMLSLFGYDAKGDYERIVTEMPGRRINTAVPEQSLLLLKAIGGVSHTGGKLFDKDSDLYKTLLDWIKAGIRTTWTRFRRSSASRSPRRAWYLRRPVARGSPE